MKKIIFIFILLACIGILIWQIYQRSSVSSKHPPWKREAPPVAVEISPVQKTTIQDLVSFSGSLLPKSHFIVAPKISGRLKKLLVNISDRVTRHQLIALLDDDEYIQQMEQARAEFEVSRATLEESRVSLDIARKELQRAQTLREKKIISASDLDTTEAKYNVQKAKHNISFAQGAQKEAAFKAAQIRLSYTQIRASWEDGDHNRVVGERFADEGAMLAANAPIVSILEIGSLMAVIHVIEADYSQVRPGQKALITSDAFPDKSFSGTISRVSPQLKESSRQARVEIEVPNPVDILKPGMFIRAQIEFARHDNATVIPLAALVKRNNRQGVFIADRQNMKAHFIPVKLGITNNGLAEVLEPPIEEWVVILGQHLLEEGSPIILTKKPQKGQKENKTPLKADEMPSRGQQ